MFLEELNRIRPLPKSVAMRTKGLVHLDRTLWKDFLRKLRNPKQFDTSFFLVLEADSTIVYLDEVSWFDGYLAGYNFDTQAYRRFSQDSALEMVIDFGYLDNGLLQESHWLTESYFQKYDIEIFEISVLLPSQLSIDLEFYGHYSAIANHDISAIRRILDFPITEINSVPFKLDYFVLEEFSPLSYAVAYDNLSFVIAVAEKNIPFSGQRSYDNHGLTHIAAQYGSCAMLRAVLAHGSELDDLDLYSFTPLETAVHMKRWEHANCLLAHNADPNFGIKSTSKEVDHAVALCEMSPIMYKRLKNAGARFDLRTVDTLWTPLHYNASRFHRDTFIEMVRDGLNPHAADYHGETPFDQLKKDVPKGIFDEVYRVLTSR
jgi:ankyrin repeat protein